MMAVARWGLASHRPQTSARPFDTYHSSSCYEVLYLPYNTFPFEPTDEDGRDLHIPHTRTLFCHCGRWSGN